MDTLCDKNLKIIHFSHSFCHIILKNHEGDRQWI